MYINLKKKISTEKVSRYE